MYRRTYTRLQNKRVTGQGIKKNCSISDTDFSGMSYLYIIISGNRRI